MINSTKKLMDGLSSSLDTSEKRINEKKKEKVNNEEEVM